MSLSESWMQQFHDWHDFYVIVGGSAAGLTGLMFVVVSLGPSVIATRGVHGVHAFITPTVFFFATVLVTAAVMTIPTVSSNALAVILGGESLAGIIYMLSSGAHKTWKRSELDWLDWLWYIALPILSYLLILGAAAGIWMRTRFALETVGATMILLLIIGIRNAWDLVLWMAKQTES